jgi:hypothetical protein
MAIVKDWAIEAAVDIIDHVRTGSTLEWVAEKIHKHCPFKPGVAYMPVPRCDSCQLWGKYEPGDCPVILGPTAADFGCVQWKEKA